VRADFEGAFPDTLAHALVKIGSHPHESTVTVSIPVHCETYDGAVGLADPSLSKDALKEVKLSDPTGPVITIANSLSSLAVHVTGVTASSTMCKACWKDQINKPIDVVIPPQQSAQVQLGLPPRSLSAMFNSAFVLKRESPHDILQVNLSYNADQGGSTKTKPLLVRVRFTPMIWQLVLAVLVGPISGIILRRILDPQIERLTVRWVCSMFALALAAEFFSVVAAAFDSKLVLFSFDLDPRQFVPTVLLSLVVTGGQPVLRWLTGLPGGVGRAGSASNDQDSGRSPAPAGNVSP
jgi:hypothetical protein